MSNHELYLIIHQITLETLKKDLQMKLVVIGGGGVRSIYLSRSIIHCATKTGIDHIVFMDNDAEKLSIFGKMAQQIAKDINPQVKFELTTDPVYALKDANIIITTIRVGNDAARIHDEKIALNLGLLGQETTGAGGFAFALRSVPALIEYCYLVKKHAKSDAVIFNFTNPSGIITQALRDAGFNNVFGVCDEPSHFAIEVQRVLGVTPEQFSMRCYGLNHLSWFDQICVDNQDITQRLIGDEQFLQQTHMRYFDKKLIQLNGNVFMNEYLYFFFYREKAIASIIESKTCRSEYIYQLNQTMIAKLKDIDIESDMSKAFEIYMQNYRFREFSYFSLEVKAKRELPTIPSYQQFLAEHDDGGYAGVVMDYILIKASGKPGKMVLSVPNDGAISGLAASDVVEISCIIDHHGVTPQAVGEIPPLQLNLMRMLKFYEKYTVQAIAEKSRDKAIMALVCHPLISSFSLAEQLVDQYLSIHEPYVGVWQV